ncbi:hypothetical protein KJ903_05315 [Patescibacteria group bacterium]|nr:hypothetical protein [Patescibacteria group bacterium]
MKITLLIIKIIVIIPPLCLLGWVLNKQFAPGGTLILQQNFRSDSPFISDLYPSERTERVQKEGGNYVKTIIGDTVYFDLTLPRLYKKAEVSIAYKNESQPLVNLGVQNTKQEQSYLDQGLENKFIDQLTWSSLSDDSTTLWQKKDEYQTISDFTSNPPTDQKIATYNFNDFDETKRDIQIENYRPQTTDLVLNTPLQGAHTILTYLDQESLSYTFQFKDINQAWGGDSFTVEVYNYKTGNKIKEYQVNGDGISESTRAVSSLDQLVVDIPDLPRGVYNLVINAGNDVVISNISTKQQLIMFARQIHPTNSCLYDLATASTCDIPVKLYSKANTLNISTNNLDYLQDVVMDEETLKIEEVDKKYVVESKAELSTIDIPKSNVIIESDGYFVLAPEHYFTPQRENIIGLSGQTNLDDIDYIIANYNSPPDLGDGWKEATVEFDLTKTYINDDQQLKFRLSAPGLYENQRQLKINHIKVKLEKDPITWDRIKTKIKSWF